MEVHLSPEAQAKLDEFTRQHGRSSDDTISNAVNAYLDRLTDARETLARRYDDLESGAVRLIDGEEFFENLRLREEELLKKSTR
jgi:predicted transcriptional regulator